MNKLTEIIHVRVTPEDRKLIEAASVMAERRTSDFTRLAVVNAARNTVNKPTVKQ